MSISWGNLVTRLNCFLIALVVKFYRFRSKSITDKLSLWNMPFKYGIISVLIVLFVPLSVTTTAQSLDIFCIETKMFSATLAKSSAVNSQECDTESKASVQSNQTVIKFCLCFLLPLKLLYL